MPEKRQAPQPRRAAQAAMATRETRLAGGRLDGGGLTPVVRVGRTVCRQVGPWTPAVHALLRHLERRGFAAAPRVIEPDVQGEDGYELLTFIEGTAGVVPGDEGLVAVAHLIRRYHEAVADFVPPPDSRWQFQEGAPRSGPVCHNDLSPANTVWRDGAPCAFIDWDFAAPAPRLWDLAYAAWRFVGLYEDADCARLGFPVASRGPRLRRFCDAYGLRPDERAGFIDLVRARQQALYDTVRIRATAGEPAFAQIWRDTRGEQWLRTIRYLDAQRSRWEQCLAE